MDDRKLMGAKFMFAMALVTAGPHRLSKVLTSVPTWLVALDSSSWHSAILLDFLRLE